MSNTAPQTESKTIAGKPAVPAIEVHDLTVSYNRRPVLWGVDFALPIGAMVGIMGPNGSGKTTLIKSMLGLVPLDSGWVKIAGQTAAAVRRRISYVPQRNSVDWDFPASVYDVVLMGRYGSLGLFRRPGKADRAAAMAALEQVGMHGFANRQISQLSGGQQQRVFLARAIVQNADIYFLDEPFAGVDMATESQIVQLLMQMKAQGKTIVVVHHDLRTAPAYFDWIVLLNQRLVSSGPLQQAFTEQYLQEAYGGRLTMLSQIGELFAATDFPRREKKP